MDEEKNVSAEDITRLRSTEAVTVERFHAFSFALILSARNSASAAGGVEQEFTQRHLDHPGDLAIAQMSHVLTSIVMSVAFLESTVNELFVIAPRTLVSQIGKNTVNKWTEWWNETSEGRDRTDVDDDQIETISILRKYQAALEWAGREKFDTSRSPYQDVGHLVVLRNSIIHYKPEWIKDGQPEKRGQAEKMTSRLGKKFGPNPLLPGNDWYPDNVLHHRCADWAVKTSLGFTDEFFRRLGIEPPYREVLPELG